MGKLKIFFKDLKNYSRSPELKRFWLFLGLVGLVFIVDFFFLPPLVGWLTLIFFFGFAIFRTAANIKIAKDNAETRIKSKESNAIIENLDAGVIGYDLNFKIVTFNRAAEEIFGLNAQEVIGQYIGPNFSKNPHFRQLTQVIFPSLAPIVRPVSEPNAWPQIADITLEEPSRELRTILNRITDNQNKVIGFFKVIRDQTREKAVLKSKSEFISVAAHQMRTPLTAISWAFENLLKLVKEKDILEMVKTGYEVSQRTLKIVNDLLDVAKIEEGKFGYNFEEVDLKDFIETVLNQFKPMAEQYQINLYVVPWRENVKVRIDPQKLTIAFSNILDNAIKYNVKNGKVEVSVERLAGQPFVQVNVQDTGIGIPANEMSKVFQKFFRGSNAVQLEPNGSGLGLYITKNIVQQHGGKISIESVADRGTNFSFTLPLDYSLISSREVGLDET